MFFYESLVVHQEGGLYTLSVVPFTGTLRGLRIDSLLPRAALARFERNRVEQERSLLVVL